MKYCYFLAITCKALILGGTFQSSWFPMKGKDQYLLFPISNRALDLVHLVSVRAWWEAYIGICLGNSSVRQSAVDCSPHPQTLAGELSDRAQPGVRNACPATSEPQLLQLIEEICSHFFLLGASGTQCRHSPLVSRAGEREEPKEVLIGLFYHQIVCPSTVLV